MTAPYRACAECRRLAALFTHARLTAPHLVLAVMHARYAHMQQAHGIPLRVEAEREAS